MIETTAHRGSMLVTVISALMVVETLTFLLAALSHLGIQFLPGFSEPRIIPAAIVEGLCGVFLAVATYGVFVRKIWAWGVALAAHIFAVGVSCWGSLPLHWASVRALRRTPCIIESSWWCC